MERESNPMEALCRSGCGFYGNPATDGLCSVCFKEALKKKQQPPVSSGSSASVVGYSASSTSPSPAPAPATRLPVPDSQLPADEQDALSIKSSNSTIICDYSNTKYGGSTESTNHSYSYTYQDAVPQDMESTTSQQKDKLLEDRDTPEDREGNTSGSASSGEQEDVDAQDKDPAKDKKKKNRCAVCRKKVGLTGFECRCGGLFCSVHRYSDKHDCTFDYRELGAQEIRRNNPVVVGEKIQKI